MTERQSPPTERVVHVLNLFADHPDRRWSLTGAAEALGLTKATCLGILSALTDSGFTTRDGDKTYGPGPALLRIGWAAEAGLASLDAVRPHVAALHERLGLGCLLVSVQGDHLVSVDRTGPAGPGDHRDLVGDRYPFAPPLGLVNVAWGSDATVGAWLSREPLMPMAAGREEAWALVRAARATGHLVTRRTPGGTTPNIMLAALLGTDLPRGIVRQIIGHLPPADWSEYVAELPADDRAELAVWGIYAPVHDRRGEQRYTLSLLCGAEPVTAGTCRRWAAELTATARAASAALGAPGRP